MPTLRGLNSVAHSIGHHTSSGLCQFIDEIFPACQQEKIKVFMIDLLIPEELPKKLHATEQLRWSYENLILKFEEILKKSKFTILDVKEAKLRLDFDFALSNNVMRHKTLHIKPLTIPAYTLTATIRTKRDKIFSHQFKSLHHDKCWIITKKEG